MTLVATDLAFFAAAAVAVAAASLSAFGLRRRGHPGWSWWVTAVWLTVLGTLIAALLPGPAGAALAGPLLLQWPLLTLIGVRRFFSRRPWPGSERSDALLLVVACAFFALGSVLLDPSTRWVLSVCGLAVHLYAAAVLFVGTADPEATPMTGLAAVMALVAFAPGLVAGFGPGADAGAPLGASAAAAALGAIVMSFVAQTLVCERTERQLRESRRRLREVTNLDALTQVPNRRHFGELATQALRHDPAGSAALLMFDVDHFGQLNDHLGHAAGDRALCLVSGSVVEHLRSPDVAGRHGGDEFVLLLRRASTGDAMRVAARIVAQVQAHATDAQLPTLSLSFGVVQVGADEEVDTALQRARCALLEAKRQGRSCAVTALGDATQPEFSVSQPLGVASC